MWTPPPVQPVQPVVRASSSNSAVSFAAIQLSQLEQDAAPAKDRRTLVEIQEEERARQVEDDFLRWWTAEEERLKEEQAAVAALVSGKPQKPKKVRAPKGKPSVPGGVEAPRGGGKAKTADGPKPQRTKPAERGREGEVPAQQGQEQGQGGKPRRRRHAPGTTKEEVRKAEARS